MNERTEFDHQALGLPGGLIGHVDTQTGLATIRIVMVDDDAQGSGVGRRIVSAFEAWARKTGATRVVGMSMPGAEGFWRKAGYTVQPADHTDHHPIHKDLNTEESDVADVYLVDPNRLAHLERIMTRLYAPEPLSDDERRDLANHMHVIVREIQDAPISEQQLCGSASPSG